MVPVGTAADTRPRLARPSAPDAANDSLALLIRAEPTQLEHAVRLQTLMMSPRSNTANLDPSGQLLLTLKLAERNAAKADFAELADRLGRIETCSAQPDNRRVGEDAAGDAAAVHAAAGGPRV